MDLNSATSQIQGAEDFAARSFVPDNIPPMGDFLHLGDGSPADLLENMVDPDLC